MSTAVLPPASMGDHLERGRLEHRAVRLEVVLRELRARARNHPAPHLLGRAIDGFDAELVTVRRRLSGHPSSRFARPR